MPVCFGQYGYYFDVMADMTNTMDSGGQLLFYFVT